MTPTASNQINKMDRKRRDNINDRIQQLLTMIPSEYFEEFYRKQAMGLDTESFGGDTPMSVTTPKPTSTNGSKIKGSGTRDGKPNKGQILTQAVEYITRLQSEVDAKNREEVELILKVQELCSETGTIVNNVNLENTSAEVALSKIGVGPLAGDMSAAYDRMEEPEIQSQAQPQGQPQPRSQSLRSDIPQELLPQPPHLSNFEYGGYSEYGDEN